MTFSKILNTFKREVNLELRFKVFKFHTYPRTHSILVPPNEFNLYIFFMADHDAFGIRT